MAPPNASSLPSGLPPGFGMNESMPPPPRRTNGNRNSSGKSSFKTPHRASHRASRKTVTKPNSVAIKQSDSTIDRLNSALKTPRSSSSDISHGSSVPTTAYTFLSSNHGRERREQRNISKRQLKAALKHGVRSRTSVPGRSKYSHDGITFIVDDRTNREITSFATALDLPLKTISREELDRHHAARQQMASQAETYNKSHSVILIDISGSMRNSDVQGSRTRLGAVWHSLAEDYIRQRIESGNAGSSDAISVILMGDTATLLPNLHNVPTDWVTYNQVLSIYKEGRILPGGHGCYRPALKMAESILNQYETSSCELVLAVMSDGRPSDSSLLGGSWEENTKSIAGSIASLSSRLGKRLTVSCVGMGSANQFDTLKQMTEEATNHESRGVFQVPSMSSSSIAAAISSIATSLTETLTDKSSTGRRVRKMTRENRKQLPAWTEVVDTEDYDIYMGNDVEHYVYDPKSGERAFKKMPLQHPLAAGVAVSKFAFGEGTERFAKQFFEVAADGVTVVGEPLVAKESKFVAETTGNIAEQSEKFVRRFCRINYQAQKAADAFNRKLDSIPRLDPDTVRVSFLPCSMYFVNDPEKGRHALGVEKRLFGKFEKWNSNNGWLRPARSPRKSSAFQTSGPPLAAIKEEDDGGADDIQPDVVGSSNAPIEIDMDIDDDEEIFVTHNEVAQAFSHFSYIYGGRKSLICDLQGVVDREKRLLQFTDPVVHYHDVFKEDKRGQYGRTDHGEKGIQLFLKSHECNALCEVSCKGFMEVTLD